ncbi:hypothetical protein ANN_06034 [Periplaneta americana]|uniref:Uncharacterized protein n=1 Tax=Periplaneta americana TaxID=6978 RepID=A0ABQ8TE76_PERAM|nr:hypothetical protein ANN_06034 [Periplaneta americana]
MLRKIFRTKRDEVTGKWRKLRNAELHALYSSPNIIRNITSRRLRLAGHVARMGESRNAVSFERPEGKKTFGEAETSLNRRPPGTTGSLNRPPWNVFKRRWMASATSTRDGPTRGRSFASDRQGGLGGICRSRNGVWISVGCRDRSSGSQVVGKIMEVIDALDSTDSSAVADVKSLPSEQLLEDILFIDSNFKIVTKSIILLESSKLQLSRALNIVDKVSQTVIQNNNSLISEKVKLISDSGPHAPRRSPVLAGNGGGGGEGWLASVYDSVAARGSAHPVSCCSATLPVLWERYRTTILAQSDPLRMEKVTQRRTARIVFFTDIIRNIKSRRLRWAGHVARMGESRNAYRVLVERPEGIRTLGRPRRRWEDTIKMDLREVGYDDRDWIDLAQDRDRWRTYVRAAMNLRVP